MLPGLWVPAYAGMTRVYDRGLGPSMSHGATRQAASPCGCRASVSPTGCVDNLAEKALAVAQEPHAEHLGQRLPKVGK